MLSTPTKVYSNSLHQFRIRRNLTNLLFNLHPILSCPWNIVHHLLTSPLSLLIPSYFRACSSSVQLRRGHCPSSVGDYKCPNGKTNLGSSGSRAARPAGCLAKGRSVEQGSSARGKKTVSLFGIIPVDSFAHSRDAITQQAEKRHDELQKAIQEQHDKGEVGEVELKRLQGELTSLTKELGNVDEVPIS